MAAKAARGSSAIRTEQVAGASRASASVVMQALAGARPPCRDEFLVANVNDVAAGGGVELRHVRNNKPGIGPWGRPGSRHRREVREGTAGLRGDKNVDQA